MIIKEKIVIAPYQCERTLHIYIPDKKEENERFPVLYMFDGHNLFFDKEATDGKSWGMKKYLDEHNGRVIVVGLECNHTGNERLSEFTPYSFYEDEWGTVPEKGKALLKWMSTDLKKWVDEKYPTLTDRRNTYIGGSSMGGLMALYAAMMHSDVYSKAVSVSPHIYPVYKSLREDLGCTIHENTEIYISWGGLEYKPHIMAMATDQNLQILRALMKKPGVDVIPHCFKNDDHSEKAWEKELPVWMKELNIA